MGGYFICNGIERIIRMLIQQRRHYIMALRRSSFHKRGKEYTDAATAIRYGYAAFADLTSASKVIPGLAFFWCKWVMPTISKDCITPLTCLHSGMIPFYASGALTSLY